MIRRIRADLVEYEHAVYGRIIIPAAIAELWAAGKHPDCILDEAKAELTIDDKDAADLKSILDKYPEASGGA